mmetsp:Transcript_30049/g.46549  ORF Transcript_30049/g.46549 Transcript_30049/m.46549 type:complete len:620 (-) Transcript_30049:37-1896(-)|eukprot:CAMPEP_0201541216 /NCGR_PEP_ID=MMETSP0161_2-20130828/71354_1 /ASSEMBLY_ACC=CAM_ASM_000251 /TAXON_ID=180227 /ORGANISM="Neoparamoeba aestuarina, Strain SoJaBio B1-5/56/2" /LENGTH=619 /DNA_ID=CAMNT_0047948735 /DNA_START=519 /DNA_END=2378 /DNA_ORIENTATION=+
MSWPRLRLLVSSPSPLSPYLSLSSSSSSLYSSSLSSSVSLRSFSSQQNTTAFSLLFPRSSLPLSRLPLRYASSSSDLEDTVKALEGQSDIEDIDTLGFDPAKAQKQAQRRKRLVLNKYMAEKREKRENYSDSSADEIKAFANYEDDYNDLDDFGDFSDDFSQLEPHEKEELARGLEEVSFDAEDKQLSDIGEQDDLPQRMMDEFSTDDDAVSGGEDKLDLYKPFDRYQTNNPEGLFKEEDFQGDEEELSSGNDSDLTEVEEKGEDEVSEGSESDIDGANSDEEEKGYLSDRRNEIDFSFMPGLQEPSAFDRTLDKVERLTEPSEELIERENAAAQVPSRLRKGEPEIPLSQKYDVEKIGRYYDLPKPAMIEPIYWDDVVDAFKAKGEEHKLDDVRHAWDAITTACHIHFTQSGSKKWDWGYLRRSVYRAPKRTEKPQKELGFIDEDAEPVVRERNRAKPVAMAEPVKPVTPVSKLLKLPGLPDQRESQIAYDGSTRAGGRRKTATAHVRLTPGTGRIVINKTDFTEYFDKLVCREMVMQPFYLTERLCEYDVYAKTRGGGIFSQAEAIRLGISRALQKQNPSHRLVLKRAKLLKRDPRMVERKKPGQAKAHKKNQWSKR